MCGHGGVASTAAAAVCAGLSAGAFGLLQVTGCSCAALRRRMRSGRGGDSDTDLSGREACVRRAVGARPGTAWAKSSAMGMSHPRFHTFCNCARVGSVSGTCGSTLKARIRVTLRPTPLCAVQKPHCFKASGHACENTALATPQASVRNSPTRIVPVEASRRRSRYAWDSSSLSCANTWVSSGCKQLVIHAGM
jgi:hypothetical protein